MSASETLLPALLETELVVTGMTCASCVAHVGRALRKVPGVAEATVNLATERATIHYGPGGGPAAFVAAIEHAGYGALEVDLGADDTGNDDAARRAAAERRSRVRLVVAIVSTLAVVGVGMAPGFAGQPWVALALALPAWGYAGWPFHRGALAALRRGNSNMDTLVSLGSSAAYLYSVYAAAAGVPGYAETAAAIVALITLGKYLEVAARGRTSGALRALLDLRPATARRREADGSLREVPLRDVRRGDVIAIVAGDRIGVDGIVLAGASAIDVAALTGEPIPREVGPGDAVSAGTLNGDGAFDLRATGVGRGTALARIVGIVRAAQGSTPPVQRLADRVAGIFVPVIVAIAALTFAGWLATGHPWPRALVTAVAVLVVACPCALGLATPMATIVGVGAGARRGLLFKDAVALERLARVDEVVFDKTGTLTAGRPEVVRVLVAPGMLDDDVIATAAALERRSAHPLASAIVRAAERRGLALAEAMDVAATRGGGLRGEVAGATALAGTAAFLAAAGIAGIDALAARLDPAATVVFTARDGRAIGALELADAARPTAPAAVAAVAALGIRTSILSGDRPGPVAALASLVGANAWSAEASPESKAAYVTALRDTGRRVAFVGDGINDAPALATADVGLAMGGGSEVAVETAGAAILSGDPRAVAVALELARATAGTIRANLFWAFAYNVVLVPLAVFGVVQPIFAAAAMGASSLFVVGNSLRLRRFGAATDPLKA